MLFCGGFRLERPEGFERVLQQILGGGEVEFEDFIGGSAGCGVNGFPGAWVGAGGGERVGQVFGCESGEGRIGGGGALRAEDGVLAVGVGSVEGEVSARGFRRALPSRGFGCERGAASGASFADEGSAGAVHGAGQVAGEHALGGVLRVG